MDQASGHAPAQCDCFDRFIERFGPVAPVTGEQREASVELVDERLAHFGIEDTAANRRVLAAGLAIVFQSVPDLMPLIAGNGLAVALMERLGLVAVGVVAGMGPRAVPASQPAPQPRRDGGYL